MNDDKIFVIYHNGKRYDKPGRKIAYLTKGAAKSVITNDSKELAQLRYDDKYWELSIEERNQLAKEIADKEFQIIEYVPKGETKI
jgi:hypothetical protein